MILLAALLLMAPQQTGLPDAPVVQPARPPFSMSLTLSERDTPQAKSPTWDLIPSLGLEYKVNRYRFGISVGRSTNTGYYTFTGAVNLKLLEWGRLKAPKQKGTTKP